MQVIVKSFAEMVFVQVRQLICKDQKRPKKKTQISTSEESTKTTISAKY